MFQCYITVTLIFWKSSTYSERLTLFFKAFHLTWHSLHKPAMIFNKASEAQIPSIYFPLNSKEGLIILDEMT